MKILIEIRCDTKEELLEHLQEIKRQLKAQLRGVEEPEDDFQFEDANCYGEHEVFGYVNEAVQMAIDESQVNKNR